MVILWEATPSTRRGGELGKRWATVFPTKAATTIFDEYYTA